jgi:hypothetical protein
MPDLYDRMLGSLHGLPDVISTKPATVRTVEPLIGHSKTFIVQTYRQREVRETKKGEESSVGRDTIFLEAVGREGAVRLVIPPAVADTIARQRDALTARSRSKAARAVAQERKDRGETPFRKKVAE